MQLAAPVMSKRGKKEKRKSKIVPRETATLAAHCHLFGLVTADN